MRIVKLLVLLTLSVYLTMESEDTELLDRYIIACHTTDFACFKQQYRALRDHVLLGNTRYGIAQYKPFVFTHDSGTCIKVTGLEESELIGLRMDSKKKEFALTLKLPFHIAETVNSSLKCELPTIGDMKKFSGHATIDVEYPYELRINNAEAYMVLKDENLDMVLDIPVITQMDTGKLNLSDWAYKVVQNIDAAQDFALPYTTRLRLITELVPIHRFLLLYPDEEYSNLKFKFKEKNYRNVLGK